MKKSQVLAALALAFALGLGVVAPVANTYAVYDPTNSEQASKLNSDLTDTVAEAKKVSGFSVYNAMLSAIDTAETAIEGAEKSAATTLYGQLTGENINIAADGEDANNVKLNVTGIKSTDSYDTLVNAARNYQGKQVTFYQQYTKLPTEDYNKLSAETKAAVVKAQNEDKAIAKVLEAAQDDIDTAVTNLEDLKTKTQAVLGADAITELTSSDNYKKAGTAKQAEMIITAAKANKDYNYFANLVDAIDEAEKIAASNDHGIADGQKALDTLKAAIKGTNISGGNEGTNKKVTLTTENVTVTGEFEDGVVMTVEKVERKVAAFGDRKTAMYDIKLMKDGKAYNFDGSAVVTIKFEGVDGSKAGVYYVKNDNTADFMKGAEIKGDVATFTTSHFSVYAIVEDAAAGLPNTGVISAAVEGNASTTVAMVAGIATALTAAGAGVVAYRNARRSVRK